MKISQKIKNKTTIRSTKPSPGYTAKENETRISKRYLYLLVYYSIIHNSQDTVAIYVSVKAVNDKENMVYTNNETIIRCEKEGNPGF